jgi:IclR family transcriptional regulator, KDG regulon repressor
LLSTLQKSGDVLDLFTVCKPEWGVTEVAQAQGLPKSSAHALLSTLTEMGLLQRTGDNRYRLGWRVLVLARVIAETSDLREESMRRMRQLVARFGETTHLGALERGEVVYILKIEGTNAVRIRVTGMGARLPAHCTSLGKVLLAARPVAEVERIVAEHPLKRYTPKTIHDEATLFEELERVRAQGYAYDDEEALKDIACVAAPVLDASRSIVVALSMSAPAFRFKANRAEYTEAIVKAAAEISASVALAAAVPGAARGAQAHANGDGNGALANAGKARA